MKTKELDLGVVSCTGEWVLPKRLRQGIREALDGGRGRLRMDPEDLAVLIGAAIDREVERLHRIAAERERKRRVEAMFAEPEKFFRAGGVQNTPSPDNPFQTPVEWQT